jgi:hypothetical protein
MSAICNTRLGDVLDCVKEMKSTGFKEGVIQIPVKAYNRARNNRDEVIRLILDSRPKHVINMTTLTVHHKNCPILDRVKNECKIKAELHNVKRTGLHSCKHCL